jgi:glycosyltransferase involved in cell wall biosynthesis
MHNKSTLVSIITPCLNSAEFIERTINSVLNQSYKNIEYIIIDGGSVDGTVDIIKKYEDKLSYWLSEPDDGLYCAINKGMHIAKGEIVGYLNSDDIYYPDTLKKVISFFCEKKEIDLVYGKLNFIDINDSIIFTMTYPSFNLKSFSSLNYSTIGQPSSFWRRDLMINVNYFNENFKLAADFDFFIKSGKVGKFHFLPEKLAGFRIHRSQLTEKHKFISRNEVAIIHKNYRSNRYTFPRNFLYNFYFKLINIKSIIIKLFPKKV